MFMWRPGGPIAGRRESYSGHDPSCFDICSNQYIQIPFSGRLSGNQMKFGILAHILVGNELQWISLSYWRRDLGNVAAGGAIWLHFNIGVSRNVDRIVAIKLKTLATSGHRRLALQTNQSSFVVVIAELLCSVFWPQRDAAIVQIARCGRTGRDSGATTLSFVRSRHEACLRCYWILSYLLIHEDFYLTLLCL